MDEHDSHGHSTAAWTAVSILVVASLVMSLAVVFPSAIWFAIGAVLVVLGVVAGKVLSMAGFGTATASSRDVGARPPEPNLPADNLPGDNQVDSGTS